MKSRISLGMCIVFMLVAAFVTFQITYSSLTNKYESSIYSFNKYTDVTGNFEAVDTATDDDDWRELYSSLSEADAYARNYYFHDIDEEALVDNVLHIYTLSLNDKFAAYYSKDEYSEVVSSNVGTAHGIGVRVTTDTLTGGIYVYEVMQASPADEYGIKAGDIITSVDDTPVSQVGFSKACDMILSVPVDKSVSIDVLTKASSYRENVKIDILKKKYDIQTVSVRMLTDEVALVKIHEFNYNTGVEFASRMDAAIAGGAKRFIFDVRSNPGGIVDGVAQTLDYLLPEGNIITTKSKIGEEEVIKSDEKSLEAPMVVLVDSSTASGGELFAAALRDYEMATLIGTTTYGKGSMQTEHPLSDGSCIAFTTHMYYPPCGESYDGVGITPHKVVELTDDQKSRFYRLSDDEDSQLMAALDEVINK